MKTQEEYNAMTRRELWDEMQTNDKYELRKIHKALRKFGDDVPFMYRYPDLPNYLGLSVLIISGVVLLAHWLG